MRKPAVEGHRRRSRLWKLHFTGLVAWLALCACVSETTQAQSFSLERDRYYAGEEIPLHYHFVGLAGHQRLIIETPDHGFAQQDVYINPGARQFEDSVGVWKVPAKNLVSDFHGDTFEGIVARMFFVRPGAEAGPPIVERYLRIINPVRDAPGSLTLKGRRFAGGRSIEVTASAPPAGDGEQTATAKLVLFKPARRLPGGAILPAVAKRLLDVEGEGTYRITTPTMPGDYELQLRYADGFIIDRVRFVIDLDLPKIAMSLPGEGPYPVGSVVRVSIAPMYVPWGFAALYFRVLVPNGRGGWKEAEQSNPFEIEQSGADPRHLAPLARSFDITPGESGPHRLIAYWGERNLRIEAATLDFEVTGSTDEETAGGWPSLKVPKGPLVTADQEIRVAVNGSDSNAHRALELQLYKLTPEEIAGPIRLREELPGPPAKRWDVDAPGAVVMPDDLALGTYEVYLFDRNMAGAHGPMMLDAQRFSVVPKSGSAKVVVNGGQPVVAGRRFPVELKLPPDLNTAGLSLTMQIVFLGGELPGCHPVMETIQFHSRIAEGQTKVSVSNEISSWLPGTYEARLYLGKAQDWGSPWPDAVVLGAQRFEVVYRPHGATLQLPDGVQYREGDKIDVRAEIPDDMRPLLEKGGLTIEMVRVGEYADSGALRPALPVQTVDLHNKSEQVISADRHGVYELRLTMHDAISLLDTYRSPILDSKRIVVLSKTWRGPPTLLPRRPGPSGVEVADGTQDFPPIGARGSCGDRNWVPPPDVAIDARIVVLHHGKFVPFDGGLNFGQPFAVEGRLKDPALHPVYRLELEDDQDEPFDVFLYPTDKDPRLLRSKLLYLMWDVTAADAQGRTSHASEARQ